MGRPAKLGGGLQGTGSGIGLLADGCCSPGPAHRGRLALARSQWCDPVVGVACTIPDRPWTASPWGAATRHIQGALPDEVRREDRVAQSSTARGFREHKGLTGLLVALVILVFLILLWRWDWFIPLVETRASAALGRRVTLEHLHVRLGRTTRITADAVTIAGTDRFPAPLATIDHLTIGIESWPLITHLSIVLPLIDVDHPIVGAVATADGANNWGLGQAKADATPSKPATSQPSLGVLQIEDGHVHVADAKAKADFSVSIFTRNTPNPDLRPLPVDQGQIVADAKGRYAGQPVTGRFVGGAILSLRDKTRPYPVDLTVANGQTHVSLKGTLEQPLTFGGARLKLLFAGPDMSLLYPLTGVPIPQTPPYEVSGSLDYARDLIAFRNFEGRVGSSDLGGTISVVPSHIPLVKADLHSKNVDLADLGGFIGSSPGHASPAHSETPGSAAAKPAASNGDVLPSTPINMPKIRAANVRLSYRGGHIENRNLPLDNIVARLNIQDGIIDLQQLDFAVGTGTILSSAKIDPVGHTLRTQAHVEFHKIDLSRVMQATHAFHGQGIVGGRADLQTDGASVAEMLGNGTGGLTLVMSGGGDISALLPDIAGLEFGNALLSALGLPNRAAVQCFIADMPLNNGTLSTKTFLLQTSEARTTGDGTVDFKTQTLDYKLTTRSTHFSVGSLPGPISITGKLGRPSILPGLEVVARTGAAAGLAAVLPPLALLPTIQFGVGEGGVCQRALTEVRDHPAAPPVRKVRTRH